MRKRDTHSCVFPSRLILCVFLSFRGVDKREFAKKVTSLSFDVKPLGYCTYVIRWSGQARTRITENFWKRDREIVEEGFPKNIIKLFVYGGNHIFFRNRFSPGDFNGSLVASDFFCWNFESSISEQNFLRAGRRLFFDIAMEQ